MKSLKYIALSVAGLLVATSINAQVGIGRDSIRGVLDVNNAKGYGNKWGVVLPVVKNINEVKTPDGGNAVVGTVVFDSTMNCIRVMKASGWSDCLLDESGYNTAIANILNVGEGFKIKQASISEHTLCIGQDDNFIYAAGSNTNARTGLGRTVGNCQTFMLIFAQPCVSVAAGNQHSIAVDIFGQVWTWGHNNGYRTGLDLTGNNNTVIPTLVMHNGDTVFSARSTSLHGKAIQCAAGSANSYVLTEDGKVWVVGTSGSSGTGSNANVWTQVQGGLAGESVIYIAASANSCGAVTASGEVYVWGVGADGKLGTGNTSNVTSPTKIIGIDKGINTPISRIAMGFTNGAAISSDSTRLFVWGTNQSIGVGTGTGINLPKEVTLPGFNMATDTIYNVAASRFDMGTGALAAVTSIGVFTTGANGYGQLGVGNTTTPQTAWKSIVTTGVIRGTKFIDAAMSGYNTLFLTTENPVRPELSYIGYGTGQINHRQLGAIVVRPSSPTQLTK